MRTYLTVAAVLLLASLTLAAQEKPLEKQTSKPAETKPAKKTSAEPIIVARRNLPRNYAQLGLSAKQKKAIYKVLAEYSAKTERLKQELEALKEKEQEDVEAVLTPAQRDRLKELRSK